MEAVRTITGTGAPLRRSDVDTDQIIPAEWLKRVERTGFAEGLFSAWKKDPSFVLNDPVYREATILLAGPNFGVGSSREHAVWALEDHGFRAIVSPRFGDIFRNNCTKVGLVPVQVDEAVIEALWAAVEADPEVAITVDVEVRRLYVPSAGIDTEFPLDDFTQHRLLDGLDDVGLTLQHAGAIDDFEATRPAWMPSAG
ncbi:MAG: 3-isopropylmalate dehydratase small subunit [Acidimicrobiales bacterium]